MKWVGGTVWKGDEVEFEDKSFAPAAHASRPRDLFVPKPVVDNASAR